MKKIDNLHEHTILSFLTMQRVPVSTRIISFNTNTSERGVRSILLRLYKKNMIVEMQDSENKKKKIYQCTEEGRKTIDKEHLETQAIIKISEINIDQLKTVCKLLESPGWIDIINEALMVDSQGLFKSEEQLKNQIIKRRMKQLEKELGVIK